MGAENYGVRALIRLCRVLMD